MDAASAPLVLAERFVAERLNDIKAFPALFAGVFVGGHWLFEFLERREAMISSPTVCARRYRRKGDDGSCKAADSNMLRSCCEPSLLLPSPTSSAVSTSP